MQIIAHALRISFCFLIVFQNLSGRRRRILPELLECGILVGVKQNNREEFLSMMKGHSLTYMGEVTDSDTLSVWDGDDLIIESSVDDMVAAWKGSLDMTGGVQ